MLNRVVLVGRLTRDPEMKYTPQGVAVAQLGIAVQRFTKNETGDYDVDFFNITAWRRTAEYVTQYLKKGRLVSVDGRLQTRSWTDQATGQKRTAFEIVADNIDSLERATDGESGAPMGGQSSHYDDPAEPSAPQPQARAAAPAASRPAATRSATPAAPTYDDNSDEADPFADE